MQSTARADAGGIGPAIVGTRGGALAIGHPLGASGGRPPGTLAKVRRPRGGRRDLDAHLARNGEQRALGCRAIRNGAGQVSPWCWRT